MNSTHDIIFSVKTFIENNNLLEKNDKVLISISGGPDSTFLLYSLLELKPIYDLNLSAFHLNYNFRGEESKSDERYVCELCKNYNIPLIFKENFKKVSSNLQLVARNMRYDFYKEIISTEKVKVALGHTLDDQIETFFERLFLGTSLQGLKCIPIKRKINNGFIIRPLMGISKAEIIKYLDEKSINYRIDSSNLKDKYMRNKVRLNVLPVIEKYFPEYKKRISKTIEIIRNEEKILKKRYINRKKKIVDINKDIIQINYNKLINEQEWLKKRLLRWILKKTKKKRFLLSFKLINYLLEEIQKPYLGGTKDIFNSSVLKIIIENKIIKIFYNSIKKDDNKIKNEILLKNRKTIFEKHKIYFFVSKNLKKDKEIIKLLSTKGIMVFDLKSLQKIDIYLRNIKIGDHIAIDENGKKKNIYEILKDKKIPRNYRKETIIFKTNEEIIGFYVPKPFFYIRTTPKYYLDINSKNSYIIKIKNFL